LVYLKVLFLSESYVCKVWLGFTLRRISDGVPEQARRWSKQATQRKRATEEKEKEFWENEMI